jgi:hypothetical protein
MHSKTSGGLYTASRNTLPDYWLSIENTTTEAYFQNTEIQTIQNIKLLFV